MSPRLLGAAAQPTIPASPDSGDPGAAPRGSGTRTAPGDLDLGDIATFAQVVESGGFTAAARVLQVPKSSVSRKVKRLEQRLGAQLLHRSTRAIALTDAGHDFFQRVSHALAEVDAAVTTVVDAREVPRGLVRFTAPPDLGAEVLPALLVSFAAQHPLVRIEVDLLAHTPELGTAGYDLALLLGRPPERGHTTVRLQDMAFRLYASPAYLSRAGSPGSVTELADHSCVLFRAERGQARWRLHRRRDPDTRPRTASRSARSSAREAAIEVDVEGAMSANDMTFVRRAAVADAGIALLPRLVGEISVAAGELVPILPAYETTSFPLYLAHRTAPHLPLAVRALRDFLLTNLPH